MFDLELSPAAQQWLAAVLIWLGFGIVAGMLAKALLPGRKPEGAMGTLVIGTLGSALGPFCISLMRGGNQFNPIGPWGLLSAVLGAVVLLAAYRLLFAMRTLEDDDPEDYAEEESKE